jgi:hypothetical protein
LPQPLPNEESHLASILRGLPVFAAALAATAAWADYRSFAIDQVYSNADGTVQFVVLHETQATNGGNNWSGRTFTSTHGGVTKSFAFPADLPAAATANRRVLIGSQGLAALGFIAPDYVIPNGFLAVDGGTLNFAGADTFTYASLPTDGVGAISRTGAAVANAATNFAGHAAKLPALPVSAVEYYHAGLDHYFISSLQQEIDTLDAGRIAGWARTGQSFRVYPSQASGGAGVNPVCRFYIPPAHGNSHFFSASPAECNVVVQKTATDPNFSGYVFESPNVFYVALPDTATGACPAGTAPVFRLWNQRIDSNHRYTSSAAIKAQMIAAGFVAEGYGPDAVIMCAAASGTAKVVFGAGSGAPNGALVSDGSSTAAASYQGFVAAADSVDVGARAGAGEVVTFTRDRPPSIQSTLWATALGNQIVEVPFAGVLATPLTIWVVASPFATSQQTALTLWQTAQQIFGDERLGVQLSPLEIVDATTNVKAASYAAFTCGAGNANVAAIAADIGSRPGRINVYLVGLVDGSTSRGNACAIGGGFVAIAAGSSAELLAHELGHDFALEHIDDLTTDFSSNNVMHSASISRQYLTEGQIFRAHLRTQSAINQLFGLRPGLPTRDCDRDTPTLDCPVIRKRLWADGGFPPN